MSRNAAATAQGLEISIDCGDDELDNLKSMDFGAMAGAGMDIATAGSLSGSVDVLYNLGLSSNAESDDVKNRAFSIVAGAAFPIGWRGGQHAEDGRRRWSSRDGIIIGLPGPGRPGEYRPSARSDRPFEISLPAAAAFTEERRTSNWNCGQLEPVGVIP